MFRLLRLFKIFRVIAKYRLDHLAEYDRLPTALKILFYPFTLLPKPKLSRGQRIRRTLEELGPVFVKFGQILSTRRDLLPKDIADELAELQDNVPPFDGEVAKSIIEAALHAPIETHFRDFHIKPLASASIAQVHEAKLLDGTEVVVKVIRPGILKTIQQDIRLLFSLAKFVQRYVPDGKRLHPIEVVEDYQNTILDELDLQREAANTSQLHRNFKGSPLLYVPEVYWDFVTRNVMVVEKIYGIPITDVDALIAQGTDMKLLAERGVEIFFTQVFKHNFFHADMHPGNIFVSTKHPQRPQYIAIDCAIIGTLSEADRYYLAKNLLAVFRRDYHAVAQLHVECGWIPKNAKVGDFESAIRSVCEPIFDKPLKEISFGHILLYLFQTARRFNMEVQPSLVLLQKTMLNIEGLGRQLYPELDLWTTAHPFMEEWLKERYAISGVVQSLKDQAPEWLEGLPQMPNLVREAVMQVKNLEQLNPTITNAVLALQEQERRSNERWRSTFLGAMFIAIAIVGIEPGLMAKLQGIPTFSWIFIGMGVYLIALRR